MMAAGTLDLLSRARAGETQALGELCALYRNYLRMVVRARLGPRLRARVELSDVVQETLVEVIRQFPGFHGQTEVALAGWLRYLVGQKLADLARYHGRVKRDRDGRTRPLDAAFDGGREDEEGVRILDVLALSQTTPSQAASRREQLARLADALAGLAEQEGDVLWLYFVDDLTFTAIGERMDLSRKSVSRLCARGLKHLRRSLGESPGGALKFEQDPVSR
jgi:RNA polymerase sigma-70 factor, ECF subfamily